MAVVTDVRGPDGGLALPADAAARFKRSVRRRRGASLFVRYFAATAFLLCGIASFVGGVGLGLLQSFARGGGPTFLVYLLLGYAAFFVVPLLLTLPFYVSIALTWREPRRIIVFRRFNVRAESRVLQKLLVRYIAPLGHVFTLADSSIHLSFFVRIPVMLGQFGLVYFRPRKVDSDARLGRLKKVLTYRLWLNVNWLASGAKVFSVRSSDEYWQNAARALLATADLIIVDLSSARQSIHWEIQQCIEMSLADRVLFVASKANEESARAWFKQLVEENPTLRGLELHLYASGQRDQEETIREEAIRRLLVPRDATSSPNYRRLALQVAATFATSVLIVVSILALGAPYLFGGVVARYAPLAAFVHQAYLYGDAEDVALERLGQDFPKGATPRLIADAGSDSSDVKKKGYHGLAAIGDSRAVPFLVERLRQSPNTADVPDSDRNLVAATLREVLMRGGASARDHYLAALRDPRPLPFDLDVFRAVESAVRALPVATLEELLRSSSEASRYSAALVLAPQADLRVAPTLLEMGRWTTVSHSLLFGSTSRQPLYGAVVPHLQRMIEMSPSPENLPVSAVVPYLDGADSMSDLAADLAIAHGSRQQLTPLLQGQGCARGLVAELAFNTRSHVEADRAEQLLPNVDEACLRMLAGGEPASKLTAALIRATRGDPAGLSDTLELLRVQRGCRLFESKPCFQYEQEGLRVLGRLGETLPALDDFPVEVSGLDQIPIQAVVALTGVVARTHDDTALRGLVTAYLQHPKIESEQSGWFGGGVAPKMADVLPERLHRGILRRALAEKSQPDAPTPLGVLAGAIAEKRCSVPFWADHTLKGRVKRCNLLAR